MTFLSRHLFGLSATLVTLTVLAALAGQVALTGGIEPSSLFALTGLGLILAFTFVGRAERAPIRSGDLHTVREVYRWSLRHGDPDVLRDMSENILEIAPESVSWAAEAALTACREARTAPAFTMSVDVPRSRVDDLRMVRLWLTGRSHIRRAAAGMYLSGLAELSRSSLSERQFEILTKPVYSAFDRVGGLDIDDNDHDHGAH